MKSTHVGANFLLLLASYGFIFHLINYSSTRNQVYGFSIGGSNSLALENEDIKQELPSSAVAAEVSAILDRIISESVPEEINVVENNAGLDTRYPQIGKRGKSHHIDEIYLLEDKDYPESIFERYQGVGQVSGISTLPSGDIAIIHRAEREWTPKTFNENNTIVNSTSAQDNLIKNDTIMILDREHGGAITTFGANLFYMPHSIASDERGNLWVSDVARHQVMRLPTSSLQLDRQASNKLLKVKNSRWLPGNLSLIWPDIILGEAFVPGNDKTHFCEPSEVAVSSDGRLVFVADGYCNRRVMVFTGTGNYLTSFGQEYGLNVVHSLALMEEKNLICLADRENARILCFKAGLDGDLESIGELMLALDYPLGRVFAILALSSQHLLVSSNSPGTNSYDLAILNPFTSELKQTWRSSDLLVPHSFTKTLDGRYTYVADMSKSADKKVFKFNILRRD